MIRNLFRLMMMSAITLSVLVPMGKASATGIDGLTWTSNYMLPEAGIQFSYPSGWSSIKVDGGMTISESSADAEAQLDNDPNTIPAGYVIAVLHFDGVEANMTLDNLVDGVLNQLYIDSLTREEMAIVSHRTIKVSLFSRGRQVIANFMLVNDTIYEFIVSGPAKDDNVSTLWESFIASVVPTGVAPLGDTFQGSISKLTLQHPEGWTTDANFPNTYFELASDLKNPAQPKGVIVTLIETDASSVTTLPAKAGSFSGYA